MISVCTVPPTLYYSISVSVVGKAGIGSDRQGVRLRCAEAGSTGPVDEGKEGVI